LVATRPALSLDGTNLHAQKTISFTQDKLTSVAEKRQALISPGKAITHARGGSSNRNANPAARVEAIEDLKIH
jgi:hypothetical protein